jgi:hypothetical protein
MLSMAGSGAKPSSNGSQGWSVPEPKCDLPQFGADRLYVTRLRSATALLGFTGAARVGAGLSFIIHSVSWP